MAMEVGMKFSRNHYIKPGLNSANNEGKDVFYNAVSQYSGTEKTGALVASWSSISPYNIESGLGNYHYSDLMGEDHTMVLVLIRGFIILVLQIKMRRPMNKMKTNMSTHLTYV